MLIDAQELSYEKQLELKRDVVVKAYKHYAGEQRRFPLSIPAHSRCRRTLRMDTRDRIYDALTRTVRLPYEDHPSLQCTSESCSKGTTTRRGKT